MSHPVLKQRAFQEIEIYNLKNIYYLCGVYGDRDMKTSHSNFSTIYKKTFLVNEIDGKIC